jgi:CIC family chloride channel protein
MLGGSVGTAAHHLFPAYTATPGAYALVGMGLSLPELFVLP